MTVTATDNDTPAMLTSAIVIVFVDDGNDAPRWLIRPLLSMRTASPALSPLRWALTMRTPAKR